MKIKEVRELETKKLHDQLAEARAKLVKVRFAVSNKESKKVRDLRKLKLEISKFLTVLNERRHEKKEDKPKTEKVKEETTK